MIPKESELKQWATSEWPDYQAWLFHHAFVTEKMWHDMRIEAEKWHEPPLISILTPVFNTDPQHLHECVYSVLTQANPNWEMCIVDDGSDSEEIKKMLLDFAAKDDRIKFASLSENEGICNATNKALEMANGEYAAFLDHDDRISPDALFYVAEALIKNRELDIIYSDRDMLSPQGFRFMHLMKPDWSPETIFSFNYTCHLSVYRKRLLDEVDGLHSEFEGSQDHDLILRTSELNPIVHHIPKVFYHWRQHDKSVALSRKTKIYVYDAVIRALQAALERRGLDGDVSEIPDLWRGNFRVRLKRPSAETYSVISLDELENPDTYTKLLLDKIKEVPPKDYVIVLGPGITSPNDDMLQELVSWFQIPEVGIVTGKIVDGNDHLLHAGLVHKADGVPLSVFYGDHVSTPGYMAATSIVRNVSSPHPYCFAIRRQLLDGLEDLLSDYSGPHSVFDLSISLLEKGFRCVFTPFACFQSHSNWHPIEQWPETDRAYFAERWKTWLENGDPYYNKNLSKTDSDMRVDSSPDISS